MTAEAFDVAKRVTRDAQDNYPATLR